jgi:hypothetical protein
MALETEEPNGFTQFLVDESFIVIWFMMKWVKDFLLSM